MKALILQRDEYATNKSKYDKCKLILLKSKDERITEYVVRGIRLDRNDRTLKTLTDAGWVLIRPESMPMSEIVMYCATATHALVSFGAIQYTQMNFFPNSIVLLTERRPYAKRFRYRLAPQRFEHMSLAQIVEWTLKAVATRATRLKLLKGLSTPLTPALRSMPTGIVATGTQARPPTASRQLIRSKRIQPKRLPLVPLLPPVPLRRTIRPMRLVRSVRSVSHTAPVKRLSKRPKRQDKNRTVGARSVASTKPVKRNVDVQKPVNLKHICKASICS